jgi:hypothetical protein
MQWEVGESATHPGYWSAEAVDYASEGEIYVVLFLCPDSRKMAEEYVALKDAHSSATDRVLASA